MAVPPGSRIQSAPAYRQATAENAGEQQHLAAQPRALPHLQRAVGVDRTPEMQRRRRQRQGADQQRR